MPASSDRVDPTDANGVPDHLERWTAKHKAAVALGTFEGQTNSADVNWQPPGVSWYNAGMKEWMRANPNGKLAAVGVVLIVVSDVIWRVLYFIGVSIGVSSVVLWLAGLPALLFQLTGCLLLLIAAWQWWRNKRRV